MHSVIVHRTLSLAATLPQLTMNAGIVAERADKSKKFDAIGGGAGELWE
jgi:hypothetical protein